MVLGALLMFSIVIPVYCGVTGTGNTLAGMVIEAITIFIYLLFVYVVVIHFKQNVVVAWYSEFVYFIVMGSLSFAYLRFGKWQKIKI
jgi:Na+-driven multidrug efflux pump